MLVATFQYWKRRLAKDDGAPSSESGRAVIDLSAFDDRPAGCDVEIVPGDSSTKMLFEFYALFVAGALADDGARFERDDDADRGR